MIPESEDFVAIYSQMGELELVELARLYDSLTDAAQTALRAEFAHRHLDPPLIDEIGGDLAASRNLITLHRYRDLSEAIVVRTLLESAGICVYLADENLVRLDWQISNFIGGIRLQVGADDEAVARELLAQPIPHSISFGDTVDFAQPHCPICNSIDITFEGSSRGAALASLYLLSVPLPLGNETWLCNQCGARWQDHPR